MRKTLLSILVAASCISASAAAPTLTPNWSKSLTGINEAPNYLTPVKTDATGAVIATGTFDTDFEFAQNTLEAIGTSSYILKYAADGTPAWGVALTGAATITAVDTDADGNIYVAGTFADEVTFNTTSGDPITEMGKFGDNWGDITYCSSFIAKYNASGKIQSIETFDPEILDGVKKAMKEAEDLLGWSYYENIYPSFKINKITIVGEKIYVSALYQGITKKGSITFDSSYLVTDMYLISDLTNGVIFSINKSDLQNYSIESSLRLIKQEYIDVPKEKVNSVAFTLIGEKLYAAYACVGSFILENSSLHQEVTFRTGIPATDTEGGYNEYGFIVCDNNSYFNIPSTNNDAAPENNICSVVNNNGLIYAIGNYQGILSEKEGGISAIGKSDLFVFSLNPSDLTMRDIQTYDSGNSAIYETATEAVAYGNGIYINYTEEGTVTWKTEGINSKYFNGTGFEDAPVAATGVSTADKAVAFGQVAEGGVTFSSYTSSVSGITDITTDGGVSVFPNPVVDVLNFSEPVDVIIYSLNGSVVKTASQVSTLNVTDLATGLYIVKAGDKAVRVIKK